ncbi:MAG: glycosyltransferase family 4 protein [Desulfitobacteriaceae bacterium]|nr:glycosyltransferase family 4 protein [Desulfitobacteriaceae bacterium]
MRILVLTGWYPNSRNTIKGVFVKEQVLALHEAGLDLVVYYPFDEEIGSGKIVAEFTNDIWTYRANTYTARNPYLARIAGYYRALRHLKQIMAKHQSDLIHVHVGYPTAIIACLFAYRYRIPYIITEHMSYLQDYVNKWQHRKLLKSAFEKAALVLPVSRSLEEQIRAFGWNTSLQVVPNFVNTDLFQLSEDQPHFEELKILFVGGMEETKIKGLDFLLPAFARVVKKTPRKIRLQLVGDGSRRQDYQKLTEELGISEYCTFYGQIEHRSMPGLYRQSDFLVLSSLKETFGCVLIEAMACGKPVLATACGGPEDIVNEKVGMLVQPGNVKALVQGLLCMIKSLPDFQAREIRQYALKKYSRAVLAQTMQEIYQGLQGST